MTEPLTAPRTSPPVVVGVDGSESDEQVIAWGAHEAHQRGTSMVIAHARDVIPDSPVSEAAAVSLLAEAKDFGVELLANATVVAQQAEPDVDVSTVLRQQEPEELLAELSTTAQMIVVGTHGLGRFIGALTGSVSQRLAAHARCPVVVLPSPGLVHRAGRAKTIVVGVSPSAGGMSALRFALAEAQLRDVEVLAVRCWNEPALYGMGTAGVGFICPPPFETVRESEDVVLHACVTKAHADYPGVKVTAELVESAADRALIDYSSGADLLVVGCRYEDGHRLSRLGPVSSWLLHNSEAPIAVVGFSAS